MTIQDFLSWLASGLGANVVFSFLAERWAWFQTLSVDAKKLISIVADAVLAIGAYAALTYVPASVWALLSPYWQIVAGIVVMYIGQQFFHKVDKQP